MAFLDGTPPRIIAHRGLATHHAENTLGAFGAALEAGADILETDVHLSKDGVVIIAHDPDLERVAHCTGLVSEYTAVELSDMDLGHGEGFPTLAQALHAFPKAHWNIDLKIPGVVEACVDAITSVRALDRVLVASFDEDTRAQAVHALPGVASSATSRHIMAGRVISWMGLPLSSWKVPGDIVALQIPPAHAGLALVTPSMIRLAHRKGLEVHVWTINEVKDMERLWSMGVDAIVTDHTDLAVEVRYHLS